jgi:Mg/Co/Ni transporter MgtE
MTDAQVARVMNKVTNLDKAVDIIKKLGDRGTKVLAAMDKVAADKIKGRLNVAGDFTKLTYAEKLAFIKDAVKNQKWEQAAIALATVKADEAANILTELGNDQNAASILNAMTAKQIENILDTYTAARSSAILSKMNVVKAAEYLGTVAKSSISGYLINMPGADAGRIMSYLSVDNVYIVLNETADVNRAALYLQYMSIGQAKAVVIKFSDSNPSKLNSILKAMVKSSSTAARARAILNAVGPSLAFKIVDNMVIADAVLVLNVMDPGNAADMLAKFSADKAANILSQMGIARAAEAAAKMASNSTIAGLFDNAKLSASQVKSILSNSNMTEVRIANILLSMKDTAKVAGILAQMEVTKAGQVVRAMTSNSAIALLFDNSSLTVDQIAAIISKSAMLLDRVESILGSMQDTVKRDAIREKIRV